MLAQTKSDSPYPIKSQFLRKHYQSTLRLRSALATASAPPPVGINFLRVFKAVHGKIFSVWLHAETMSHSVGVVEVSDHVGDVENLIGEERIRLLYEFMGQKSRIDIGKGDLEKL